jgi:hypothetical protein
MADADFPAAFLFQTLKVLRSYARRTQKLQMMSNTKFTPGNLMQIEMPSAALIDLDSFAIMAKITWDRSKVTTATNLLAWPQNVGAFIDNITVQINGETYQSTQYSGELDVVLRDFSYGAAVNNRMGVTQLGGNVHYTADADGDHEGGISRYITLTASDLPGFFSSIQPRVLNTSLIGPLMLSLVLKGPDVLGIGAGDGTKAVCAIGSANPPTAPLTLAQLIFNTAPNSNEIQYLDHPGAGPATGTDAPTYIWDDTMAIVDVLSMPPEFTAFNQMVLASGNSFQLPYQHYTIQQQSIKDLTNNMRFSISTMCLNQVIAWICPDQSISKRHYDEVTKRSARYNRILPGSWQMNVSGALYPSFPCRRRFSWPVFMTSISKLHDAQHEFAPGLNSYKNWTDKYGIMCYRFNVPDQDGKSWYSGLNTQSVSIQCFLETTPLESGEGVATTPGAVPTQPTISQTEASMYIAMQTTRVLSIGANKATNLIV